MHRRPLTERALYLTSPLHQLRPFAYAEQPGAPSPGPIQISLVEPFAPVFDLYLKLVTFRVDFDAKMFGIGMFPSVVDSLVDDSI